MSLHGGEGYLNYEGTFSAGPRGVLHVLALGYMQIVEHLVGSRGTGPEGLGAKRRERVDSSCRVFESFEL